MEKQQAAAIAEAVLDPHLQAQQRRSATLKAASRQWARNRAAGVSAEHGWVLPVHSPSRTKKARAPGPGFSTSRDAADQLNVYFAPTVK